MNLVCKEIPDDYVFVNTQSRYVPLISVQAALPSNRKIKLYKAQTKSVDRLVTFLTTLIDDNYSQRQKPFILYIDTNGYENEDLHMMLPRVDAGSKFGIKFTKDPVHNPYRFCSSELYGLIYEDTDLTKCNDQKYNYLINECPDGFGKFSYIDYVQDYPSGFYKGYCYCFNAVKWGKPIKFDIRYDVYEQNINRINFLSSNYILQGNNTIPRLVFREGTTFDEVNSFIQSNKGTTAVQIQPSNSIYYGDYVYAFHDINYLDYDDIGNQCLSIDRRSFLIQTSNNKYIRYGWIPINDTYKKFSSIQFENGDIILLDNMKIVKCSYLYVLKDCPYRVTSDGTVTLDFKVVLNQKVIPQWLNLPQLRSPVNDPANYSYNKGIVDRCGFIPYTNSWYSYVLDDGEFQQGQWVVNNQDFFLKSSMVLNITASTVNRYGNAWDEMVKTGYVPVITQLDKIIAIDYGQYDFSKHYFFIESSDSIVETSGKMTEFVSKCMRNQSYQGQSNKGKIILNQHQYALLTQEQIDSLVDYGWDIVEVIL